MSKGLVIVESPAKAKTIQKYLGKGFTVEASLGHVKDLPKSTLGVDIKNDFETDYVVIPGKEKVVARLKKLAARRMRFIWRLTRIAKARPLPRIWRLNSTERQEGQKGEEAEERRRAQPPRIQRVTFNEITKRAVQAAFEHPRAIDQNLVDAQQARRVLDRLVGYQVSPLLWDKVRRGLSAGRVQTVALRLIVEREREIKAFEKKEYWTIDAHLLRKSRRRSTRGSWARAKRKLKSRTARTRKRFAPRWKKPTGWCARSTRKSAAATPRRRSPPASCNRIPRASCASA